MTKKWVGGIILAFFLVAVGCSLVADYRTRTVYARSGAFHVVIDAGHGGRDGGAVGRAGTIERDINLKIAKHLRDILVARGVGVTMTRENEKSLANPFAKNQKKSDMEERRKIIERVAPDLIVSIHLNSLQTHPAVRGAQVFFAKPAGGAKNAGDTAGGGCATPAQKYASQIQDALNGGNLHFNRKAAVGDYFMLNCTAYPSVLVECGFLSNANDEKLLNTTEYQKMLANFIAQGILGARFN